MLRKLLNSETKTVTFGAALLGFSAIISRIFGLIRDRLLASTFGAGQELDIYFAAFRIPDFVYGLLILGGISGIFLPVFAEYFIKDKSEAWRLANNVLNCFFVLVCLLCLVLAVFTPFLMRFIVPGFKGEQMDMAVSLTRIMFLSPIFFALSSVYSGVLQYFNRLFIYSLAPIIYNLGIIFGILFLTPRFGVMGLALGVILGALLHWLIQVPSAVASGFKYSPVLNFRHEGLRKIFKLMIPRIIGTAAYNFNLIIVTAIASVLAEGSIAIFNFANNFQGFPVGVIGASFALASFPALARAWANGERKKFIDDFALSFRQILFLIAPISVLMFVLRAQIIKVVLGVGKFNLEDMQLTAASLGVFCFGIFAVTLVPFLARVFHSFQDTKTPVYAAIISIISSIVLSFFFIWALSFSNFIKNIFVALLGLGGFGDIRIVGLSLALSFSGIIQFFLLIFYLRKKMGDIKLNEIWNSAKKIIFSSLLMGVSGYYLVKVSAIFLNTYSVAGVLIQSVFVSIFAGLVYVLVSIMVKSEEMRGIFISIFKRGV